MNTFDKELDELLRTIVKTWRIDGIMAGVASGRKLAELPMQVPQPVYPLIELTNIDLLNIPRIEKKHPPAWRQFRKLGKY